MCESTFVSSLPTHDPSALSRYFFRCGATARGCDANVYVDAAGSLIPVDILPCMRKRWQYTDERSRMVVGGSVGRERKAAHTHAHSPQIGTQTITLCTKVPQG